MDAIIEKCARSLVVLLAAGGDLSEIVAMAHEQGVTAGRLNALTVPDVEEPSRRQLAHALRTRRVLRAGAR